ncbi:MAG: hypothetical protein IT433_09390, partial [Phycisphaerales bacterium]|nr:hypothetical protein [Phycisphaerales bacterium]
LGLWGASLAVRGLAARIDALASRLMRVGARALALGRTASLVGTLVGLILLPAGCILCVLALNYDPGRDLSDALPSLWTGIGIVGAFASLAIVFVGIQFDPARGRARCPACWYAMQGFETYTCPECGRPPGPRAHLLRTRRSRPVIAFGVAILLLSLCLSRVGAVRAMGWKGVFPTTLLILGMEHLPDSLIGGSGSMAPLGWRGTLADRMQSADMAPWQESWAQRRAADLYRNAKNPGQAYRAQRLGGAISGADTGICDRLRDWVARDLASADPGVAARAHELAGGLGWVFDPQESRRNDEWLLELLSSEDPQARARTLTLLPYFPNAGPLITSTLTERLRDESLPNDQREYAAMALVLAPVNAPTGRQGVYDFAEMLTRGDPATRLAAIRGLRAAASSPFTWNSQLRGLVFNQQLVLDLLHDPDPEAAGAGAVLVNAYVSNTGEWNESIAHAMVTRIENQDASAAGMLAALVAVKHPGPLPKDLAAALQSAAAGSNPDLAARAKELLGLTTVAPGQPPPGPP